MKSIDSIVLDTTYILPLFGIKVIKLPKFKEASKKIWTEGLNEFKIILPSVCLIEVMYKILSDYRKTNDPKILNRYVTAIPSISTSQNVKIYDPSLSQMASQIAVNIRLSGHSDIMDCWIAASAVVLDAILLTEDKELEKILLLITDTKDIKIWSWKKLIENILED